MIGNRIPATAFCRLQWLSHCSWALAALLAVIIGGGHSSAQADEALDALVELEGRYTALRNAARYTEALPIAEEMLAIAERDFSNRPQIIAISDQNLAFIYIQLGRYDEAEKLYLRSLSIFEELYGPDHTLVADNSNMLANVYFHQRRFQDAIKHYRRSSEIQAKAKGPESEGVALAEHNLAGAYLELGLFSDAEKSFRRAMKIREQANGADDPNGAETLNNFANLLFRQGRYAEAQKLYQRALMTWQRTLPPDHPRIADGLNNLGNLCLFEGRFAEAEVLYQRSLAIRRRTLGNDHQDVGQSLNNLGMVSFDQYRYPEAEHYYRQALDTRVRALGPNHPVVADSLGNLAALIYTQHRYDEAEQIYNKAIEIYQREVTADHPRIANLLGSLAVVYQSQGRTDEAEAANLRALAIYERAHGKDHPDVALVLHNRAVCRLEADQFEAALPLINSAIEARDQLMVSPAIRASGYLARAEIYWHLGKQDEALADLTRAMELAEEQRGRTSGTEQERGVSSEHLFESFEMMVRWQAELGHVAEAMAAIERGRARSLVDQLQTQGIDLLADVPQAEADELRSRDALAKQQVASLEKQLELLDGDSSLTPAQKAEKQAPLLSQLEEARAETVAVYRDMRNLSPAYRLAVSRDFKPLPLAELQTWVAKQEAVLLEYMIGSQVSHVMIVPAQGEPRVEKIVLNDELAKSLGVEPGELTTEKLAAIWQMGDADIVQLLASPRISAAAITRLSLLWKLLVPSSLREDLVAGKFKRLFVVPDGMLNALPFETLVVEAGAEPKYLVDVGPPIIYAPSAGVLVNLQQRALKATPGAQPVLTVADAVYGAAANDAQAADNQARASARSRYWDGAGPLQALPFTATESSWVVKNFKAEGIATAGLRGAMATEANVRANVAGREFLHFACHGLIDQRYGNFFGALALTPGRTASGADDDGFLTLPEIYVLPLSGCELSILSACQTNVGPQQRGEGLFGLSRGFLVAGSRRVVASNWLVDDEAAASLVSYFTAGLAKTDRNQGSVDYAQSLHDAKRWVRSQAKWQSPYYWATFVQIGPN